LEEKLRVGKEIKDPALCLFLGGQTRADTEKVFDTSSPSRVYRDAQCSIGGINVLCDDHRRLLTEAKEEETKQNEPCQNKTI
jgi:hypothetical protein